MSKRNILLSLLASFSFVGLLIALYSTWAYFDISKYNFCQVNSVFDCHVVNTSKYSMLFGVPVAMFGVLTYFIFLSFVAIYLKFKNEILMILAGTLSIVALGFSLYLTSMEAFVIHSWCILCIGSQLVAIGIFAVVMMLRFYDWPKEGDDENNKELITE